MKPYDPHRRSRRIRRFKSMRRPAGILAISVVFFDAAALALAFFLAVSPFVLQPGINIRLPESPLSGGARFGSLVLSITRDGWFYFNDERLDLERLKASLTRAARIQPGAPLIIEADEAVAHGTVVQAWNAAMAAGIREVTIATGIAAAETSAP